MEKENAYMERKIDYKKIWILYWQRVWLVISFTVAAAVLGAGAYNVVRALNSDGDIYRVSSDYYITFNEEEDGPNYYNAYTWDTILRDDPVVDVVMENLPDTVSKEEVKEAVTGEMLGDYRILTVHVTSKDPEFAQMVAKAYIKGMGQFADKISMLDTIELWSQEEVALVVEENLTANAALLGAVVGLFLGIIIWSIYYILDDSIYVEKDLTDRFAVPFLGMITSKESELCKQELITNTSYLLKEEEYYLVFAEKENTVTDKEKKTLLEKVDNARIKGILSLQGEDLDILRTSSGAVLMIPWGNKNGSVVEKTIAFLNKQDCKIAGAIVYDAEDAFLRKYYGINK